MFMSQQILRQTYKSEHLCFVFKEVLAANALVPYFQPIVLLESAEIFGYEALTRQRRRLFSDTEDLFRFAEANNELVELETLSRENALRAAGQHKLTQKLFLKCSAQSLEHSSFCPWSLHDSVLILDLDPKDIVLEITDRARIENMDNLKRITSTLRELGFKIALDDVCAGYKSLQTIAEIEPHYAKVDMAVARRALATEVKMQLLETLMDLVTRLKATVIAKGIEYSDEYHALVSLGVKFGQGFYFAPPKRAGEPTDDPFQWGESEL